MSLVQMSKREDLAEMYITSESIDRSEVRHLGEGQFGSVSSVVYMGKPVCIKTCKIQENEDAPADKKKMSEV